jgi:hypothetical protein
MPNLEQCPCTCDACIDNECESGCLDQNCANALCRDEGCSARAARDATKYEERFKRPFHAVSYFDRNGSPVALSSLPSEHEAFFTTQVEAVTWMDQHNGGAVEFYDASQDRWRLCAAMWPKPEEGLVA